jgi:8-oxo-dGTP pyrophosphatase MutT (NUDIX family)
MSEVAVIVGRFQVDQLHRGHLYLIQQALIKHGKVLILLGCSSTRLGRKNALDYETRAKMFHSAFPSVVVHPLHDIPGNDLLWSDQLDSIVHNLFPTDKGVLYASRDSFQSHYRGKMRIKEIDPEMTVSATEVRDLIASHVIDDPKFRAGVIYACYNRYPIVHPTVDVAIIKPANETNGAELLLCAKKHDPPGKGGFIGGFLEKGESFEEAAIREVMEETGLEVTHPTYIGSSHIDDPRYQDEDSITSALLTTIYVFGNAVADDDIDRVFWVSINYFERHLIPQHAVLGDMLRAWLEKQ